MSHLLEVKNLTTAFTGDYGTTVSVDNVSFHVDEGEVVQHCRRVRLWKERDLFVHYGASGPWGIGH